jgi:hypothetical protein
MLVKGSGGDPEELLYVGAVFIHAGRNKTFELGNKLYDSMEKTVRVSPYELHTGNFERVETILQGHNKYRYSLLWALVPAIERVGSVRYQTQALHEATLTILAAKRWERDKGALPESLKQLQEGGYLDALPADPYSAEPLKYARRDGGFVLYSLGEDFDDDGGVQDAESEWGRDEKGGDRVFWPVQ